MWIRLSIGFLENACFLAAKLITAAKKTPQALKSTLEVGIIDLPTFKGWVYKTIGLLARLLPVVLFFYVRL